jgi:hypothetical protein
VSLSFVNLIGLAVVAVFAGLLLFFMWRARKEARPALREIPAFSLLRRGIGLAVEAGQRLHLSLGSGGISGVRGGSALVGLALLQRIARAASVSDFPPVVTNGEAVQTALAQDTLRSAYQAVNAEAQYDPAAAQLTGVTPFSYAAGALPVIYDQQVAVNVFTGSFGPEVGLLADAAERTGSSHLAGSENLTGQAVLFAAAQEPLVGEELFAAGAYVQAGPAHLASLRAQDVLRWVVIGVLILGSLLKLVGIL